MSDNWDLEAWLFRLETLRTESLPLEERLCSICRLPYAPTSPLTTSPSTPNALTINGKAEEPTEEPTDEHPVQLPCGHIFGNQCMQKWLTPKSQGGGGGRNCPVCRERIIPGETSYSSDEEGEDGNDDEGSETEEARILRRGGYGDDEEEEEYHYPRNRLVDRDEVETEDEQHDVSESEMEEGVEYEEYDPTETGFYRRWRVRRRVSMDYGRPL